MFTQSVLRLHASPDNVGEIWENGQTIRPSEDHFKLALADCRLQDANNIASCVWPLERDHTYDVEQAIAIEQIIKKVIELNIGENVSPEYNEKFNYTLDVAVSLVERINHIAKGTKIFYCEKAYKMKDISDRAIRAISDAYQIKNEYLRAYHAISICRERYDSHYNDYLSNLFKKWGTYIDTTCPEDKKKSEIKKYNKYNQYY